MTKAIILGLLAIAFIGILVAHAVSGRPGCSGSCNQGRNPCDCGEFKA